MCKRSWTTSAEDGATVRTPTLPHGQAAKNPDWEEDDCAENAQDGELVFENADLKQTGKENNLMEQQKSLSQRESQMYTQH
jgi:hypothetical protein